MVYETFLKMIHAMVQKRLDGKAQVSLQRVLKNNGLLLDGLTIFSPESRMAPTVYLNSYYDEAEKGLPLSIITDQIMLLYEENPGLPDELTEQLCDLDGVRDRIVYKLINAEDNAILLTTVPHYRYLDLAIIFYLIVADNEDGQMTALIHEEHLRIWKISREDLWAMAEINTPKLLPGRITPIEETIAQLDAFELPPGEVFPPIHLYVLTNEKGINGAACLLYPEILKNFADEEEDDLIVLPSSIHEVLLTPRSQALPSDELNEMIRCINESEVPMEDRLANHLYCYSRGQNCLYFEQDGTANLQ